MKRKLLALLLTLAMIMSLVPTVALAAEGDSTSADSVESTDSNENTNAEKTITFSAGSALAYAENTIVVAANAAAPTLATPTLKANGTDVADGSSVFEWVCGKLTHNADGSWSWEKENFDSSSAGEYTYRMQLKGGYVYTDGTHSSNEEGYISSANYALPQIRVIVKPANTLALSATVTSSSADGLKNAVQAALPSGKSFADITSLTVTTADGATLYWTDDRMGKYADPMNEEDAFSFLLDECYNLTNLDLSGAKLKASSQSSYEYQGGTTAKPNGSAATTYNVPTDGTWFPAEALYRERTRRTDGGVDTGMKIMACLESLALPEGTTVIGMKSVRYTPNLTSITIPASVVEISHMAFQNTPDGTATASVTFAEDSALETLGNYVFAQRGTGRLTLPAGLKSIGGNCFFSSGITAVTIPDTVTEIGSSAFRSCSNLGTVDLTAVSDSINIGFHAFDNMAKNSTIRVANVTMKNMLAKNYTYTAANTSVVNTAEFTDKDTGLVCDTSTGEAIVMGWTEPTGFNGTLTIPATVTNPNDSKAYEVTAIADGTANTGIFVNKTEITSVSLGSNLKEIGNYAFYGCTGLTEITIPASVTHIGDYAFSHQRQVTSGGLKKVTFEKSSDSVTIGSRAFAQNGMLTLFDASQRPISMESMTLVNSSGDNLVVKINQASKIGPGVFMNNVNVTAIFLDSDTLELNQWAFLSGNDGKDAYGSLKNGAVIYVDDETTKELLKDSSGNLKFKNSTTIKGSERKVNNFIIAVTNGGTFADNTAFAVNKLPTPVKAGYTFGGWYTNAEGNLTQNTNGIYNASSSATGTVYYAKWQLANNFVEITYDSNMAGESSKVIATAKNGTAYTSANLFTRAGYSFKGWNTAANGNGTTYNAGDSLPTSANLTLYAQWTLDKPTISSSGTTTAVYGNEVTLTANTAATGASYQWYKDGKEVAKAINKSLTLSNVADSGAYTVKINVGTDTATSDPTTVTINKATPSISISAAPATMSGSGTVKLTVTKALTDAVVSVTCDDTSVEVKDNNDSTYTVALPNTTKTYNFKAALAESANYTAADSTCTVSVTRRSSSSGSSSSNPTYSVTTPSKSENGGVAVSSKNARKGDTVTVTVTPDAGYQLDKLTVTDKNGNVLMLTDKGDGKYSFTMPDGKVEVKAVFAKKVETSPFGDVSADAYYNQAVQWAQEKGITDGISSNLFGPKQPCTRSQIVTFLWRAAGSPEPKGTAAGMTDVVPGSYYAKAVAWAVENGITTGTAEGTFSPDATCTRAQAVTFLARAQNAKATGKTAFSDVPADSYFADAVAWAQANGVTTGTSETTFSPDSDCTRAQIVTFLYRANQGT
ncbi:leucine-rich repeat protein [Evtepia sp.]|uniref:leucine-rich repeat protein n=1 Tax=Evtepia sp. TaxID=2773933 RepID=UPI002E79D138|nr:leucine-rich repeat protein [Evtepia sp.]MEE0257134.1 leucine-rich repeat protein [Evtepia sp.]